MAITKLEAKWNPETQTLDEPREVTSHEGRVLSVYNREYRALSDVYTNATFALVVDPNDQVVEIMVNANFELDVSGGRATVDATAECLQIKAEHDRKIAAAREAREAAARQAREEEERNRPVKGKQMVVARGRKVPVGTVGTVAYISGSGSVLLKADNEWQDRKASGVWVAAHNLKAR